jgi:hypothetical protein
MHRCHPTPCSGFDSLGAVHVQCFRPTHVPGVIGWNGTASNLADAYEPHQLSTPNPNHPQYVGYLDANQFDGATRCAEQYI